MKETLESPYQDSADTFYSNLFCTVKRKWLLGFIINFTWVRYPVSSSISDKTFSISDGTKQLEVSLTDIYVSTTLCIQYKKKAQDLLKKTAF